MARTVRASDAISSVISPLVIPAGFFLEDLRKLLPRITQAEEMPQSFWDNYYRETVSKLTSYDEKNHWWRSFFAPMQTWMVPAFGSLAVAVLVIGLMFGNDNLKSFVEPRVERIPQEILADKNQLDFSSRWKSSKR